MTEEPKRPVCGECGHSFLLHVPGWFTSPCDRDRCDCQDYRPKQKAAS